MMFKLGIVTALRASDICKLEYHDVYDQDAKPRKHIFSYDIKTKKSNNSYIEPLKDDFIKYRDWLIDQNIYSKWLFPTFGNDKHHVRSHYLYLAMKRAANHLNISYVGSHSLRKTFGYIAYKKTHDLAYVMRMLNHSSPETTLRYIGLRQEVMDQITSKIFK